METGGRTVAELELELREYGVNTSGAGLVMELRSIAESWRSGAFVDLTDPVQRPPQARTGSSVRRVAVVSVCSLLVGVVAVLELERRLMRQLARAWEGGL